MRLGLLWRRMVVPPASFEIDQVERDFLDEFRSAGRTFSVYAFSIGAGLTLVTYVLVASGVLVVPYNYGIQTLRILIVVALCSCVWFLLRFPEITRDYYSCVVGGTLLVASGCVGGMAYLSTASNEPYEGRILVAFVLVSWLAFSFMRLPGYLTLLIMVPAAVPIFLSAHVVSHGESYGVLLYLCVAALIGWTSYIQIERRERLLYFQARSMEELNRVVAAQSKEILSSAEARERVLESVAHDLRQPLVSIGLYVSQLRKLVGSSANQQSSNVIDKIYSCLDLTSAAINRILDTSQSRGVPIGSIDLRGLVDKTVRANYGVGLANDVNVKILIRRQDRVLANSNESYLGLMLSNVLENAIKFSALGTAKTRIVVIAIVVLKRRIRIDVFDNGIGIPASEIESVFQRGVRGTNVVTGNSPGNGLGLSNSRELCDKLDGHKIRLRSIEGVGTRVRIYVPRASAA